jgi:hypothetical protein
MSPLKALLTAPDNLRAVAALAIIASPTRDPEELIKLLPLPQLVNLPDGKRRKFYLQRDLVAACYDIAAPPPPPKIEQRDGYQVVHSIIGAEREEGDRDQGLHKLNCFRILLEVGELKLGPETGKRIIDDCLLKGWPVAMEFAKAGKVGVASPYLWNTYFWMSHRDNLQRAIEIGLDPLDPELILNCLRFYACDHTGSYSEPEGHDLVIRKLIELGNKPEPARLARKLLGSAREYAVAFRSGILAEVEAVLDYPWQSRVPGYTQAHVQSLWDMWLNATKDPVPSSPSEGYWTDRRKIDDKLRELGRLISADAPAPVTV